MGDGGMCDLLVDDRCEDLFSILETWEECINGGGVPGGAAAAAASAPASAAFSHKQNCTTGGSSVTDAGGASRPTTTTGNGRRRSSSLVADEQQAIGGGAPMQKKQKVPAPQDGAAADRAAKTSHIAVERNRRKQMNEHLAVLRSLMPCFYVKRGDQASIIGGVVEYIKELQQVLRSLEAKKHRKAYADQVLSPRPNTGASPRPLINKSTPPLSPRVSVPISPRTPTRPGSPYFMPSSGGGGGRPPHPAAAAYMTSTASSSSTSSHDQQYSLAQTTTTYLPTLDSIVTELAAQQAAGGARPALPDVRVEFAGPNLVLKTVSRRSPGQALKIIAALESLSLEILHVSVSTVDDTMVHSFTIKIGIECELSAEDLVQEIQRTFL
ncbi:hypothetical protein QOZ80_2AG0108250 [Eleusine coracana subsp. coracana]|nr:hypothetical protein QOZ80_2AG0108250 [Eleusine coracana subsp. coracana]